MWMLATLPFWLQALCIGVDEGYFHIRRGLPLWERIGHPLDTLSFLFCIGYVLFVPYSAAAVFPYVCLALFSCLLITKDEFVHQKYCPGAEHWLHALLFIIHPMALAGAALLWPIAQGASPVPWFSSWISADPAIREKILFFLRLQGCSMSGFLMYQILYWNGIRGAEK